MNHSNNTNYLSKQKTIVFIFLGACIASPRAFAQTSDLLTKTESAVGVSLTRYQYDEPGYMALKANKLGLSYTGTYVFGTTWPDPNAQWFFQADLNYHVGSADYHSPISGNFSNTPHRYFEARALVGKDIQMDGYVLAPHVGLGYRGLYSNIGYQRDSYYSTLPIGLTHKVKMADRSQLLTSIEYMHLLRGQQKVQHPAESLNLAQSKGYGLRLSVLKRYQNWSVGPTLIYWNLGQSEVGGATQMMEPHNKTVELGLKGMYHF